MKKMDFKKVDHNYLKIGIFVFVVAAAVILFEKVVGNLPALGVLLQACKTGIVQLGSPFFIGFAMAYLMNPFMKFAEKQILTHISFAEKHTRMVRTFSILLNYFIVIGGIFWVSVYIVPEFKTSFITFVSQLSSYSARLNETTTNFFNQVDFINAEDVTKIINRILAPIMGIFQNIPQLVTDIVSNLYSVGKITFDVIMAIFISFYMLFDKEKFQQQMCKITYTLATKERAEHIFYNCHRINKIFQDFILGKALDSLIIGIIAFVGFSMLNAPFPLVLSLIIGVTNMIPYFGPFIGAIPAAIITFLVSPITAIWITLFILALQQFDGYYLGPKILGGSLDVSPLWIILAVVLGGAALGPLGMFIGVPILATVKMFFTEYISQKYSTKYPDEDPMDTLNTKNFHVPSESETES